MGSYPYKARQGHGFEPRWDHFLEWVFLIVKSAIQRPKSMFTFVKINFKLQLSIVKSTKNMLAQITVKTEDLRTIDYTDAKVTNLYMVNIGDCDVAINEPVSFQDLRKHILQTVYTPDLLKGKFGISKTPKSENWYPIEFVGVVDGTEPEEVEKYDGVCMKLFTYNKNANDVMKDVLKALPMNQLYSCSINITLKDGRKLTINHPGETCEWKPEFVDFARKFVMA